VRLLLLALICPALAAVIPSQAQQPSVRVEPVNLQGPRVFSDETKTAIVRDYLEAWQSLRTALGQNRVGALDRDFVGAAKDKLGDTIRDQVTMGISTRYLDRSHDLQIVFYSPEGLSVQLVDNVAYDVQLVDHGKILATQTEAARYVVVMTPAELRWRVRIFQGGPE
jgi:hypothetical protein